MDRNLKGGFKRAKISCGGPHANTEYVKLSETTSFCFWVISSNGPIGQNFNGGNGNGIKVSQSWKVNLNMVTIQKDKIFPISASSIYISLFSMESNVNGQA